MEGEYADMYVPEGYINVDAGIVGAGATVGGTAAVGCTGVITTEYGA